MSEGSTAADLDFQTSNATIGSFKDALNSIQKIKSLSDLVKPPIDTSQLLKDHGGSPADASNMNPRVIVTAMDVDGNVSNTNAIEDVSLAPQATTKKKINLKDYAALARAQSSSTATSSNSITVSGFNSIRISRSASPGLSNSEAPTSVHALRSTEYEGASIDLPVDTSSPLTPMKRLASASGSDIGQHRLNSTPLKKSHTSSNTIVRDNPVDTLESIPLSKNASSLDASKFVSKDNCYKLASSYKKHGDTFKQTKFDQYLVYTSASVLMYLLNASIIEGEDNSASNVQGDGQKKDSEARGETKLDELFSFIHSLNSESGVIPLTVKNFKKQQGFKPLLCIL